MGISSFNPQLSYFIKRKQHEIKIWQLKLPSSLLFYLPYSNLYTNLHML